MAIDSQVAVEGVALFVTMIGGFTAIIVKHAKTEFKVDTIWDWWIKHGEEEAEKSGMVRRRSPLVLTAEGRKMISSLGKDAELKDFWQNHNHEIAAAQIERIQAILGKELVEQVRAQNGVKSIEVVITAIAYAKEISEIPLAEPPQS
jgi:hypothetical protein